MSKEFISGDNSVIEESAMANKDSKLGWLFGKFPPQQQLSISRVLPALWYFVIGRPRRGFFMLVAIYPVTVVISSTIDTLVNDMHVITAGIGAVFAVAMYEVWNLIVIWDVTRVGEKIDAQVNQGTTG